jgi:epoxyqueuosine reductase
VPKFELSVLLNMDDQYFLETVQQLMYGYIWEKKFIQRNAAIALGNSGDEAAVGPLGKALQDQQEMVRKYSAWALGRIGGKKSRVALEKALAGESEAAVTAEIKTALENC